MIYFHKCYCGDISLLVPLINEKTDPYTGIISRYIHMYICYQCEKFMRRSRIDHSLDREGNYLWERYRTKTAFVWGN